YRHIIHASHSDRELGRCLRVVLALSRPVTCDEWPRFWSAAVERLGVPAIADRAARDAARLYFLPLRPEGSDYYFAANDGTPIDVDAILAAAPNAPASSVPVTYVASFAGKP